MRTSALYHIPVHEGQKATRVDNKNYSSMKEAREARRSWNEFGTEVGIHVGETHPDPLPFGETLWRQFRPRTT